MNTDEQMSDHLTEERKQSAENMTVPKQKLWTRFALAAAVLFGGAGGCSSNPSPFEQTGNQNQPRVEASEDLGTQEKKMDAMREQFGLSPLNSYDELWVKHEEAQDQLSPEQRSKRLARSEEEIRQHLDKMNEHFEILKRPILPYYKSGKDQQ
ncbi:hypothetical protein AUJ46_03900 [Candidatus Peregrinibacteria bacterium CG1_02_54_53]|nr:MAG: hypothetical protein AUJ46_03900 [Candidatus Peregrinibacteria bacterium CG1_02_54_53]